MYAAQLLFLVARAVIFRTTCRLVPLSVCYVLLLPLLLLLPLPAAGVHERSAGPHQHHCGRLTVCCVFAAAAAAAAVIFLLFCCCSAGVHE
jgi:hypothetical protein